MSKTIAEINEKIRSRKVVVVTAEEMVDIVSERGPARAAADIDVVTTGTFGPMCSSSAYINIGHGTPRMKLGGGRSTLNDVPAYAGVAAADLIIGATALPEDDPTNRVHPGTFRYGGAHVIEDLVAGRDVLLSASAHGTDCYPRRRLDTWLNIADLNEAVLMNPRNCYQNYNCAVNLSDRVIYTYMGVLKPDLGNANFCSAGQLSPLLNDPNYETVGIGTRIFLGGASGYVFWHGTQHNPNVERGDNDVPKGGAGTLAVTGDMKQMNVRYIRGCSCQGYGVSLAVGIGIPIPVLNERIARQTGVSDAELFAPVIDYGGAYQQGESGNLGYVSYAELKSGSIELQGRSVPTASLSSYPFAVEIAETLKDWIVTGKFKLSEPVAKLPGPGSDYEFKPLVERPPER